MVNLSKIFNSLQASKGSLRIYVPEVAGIDNVKSTVTLIDKLLSDLRDTDRDTGLAFIFSKTKIVKDGYRKMAVSVAKNVAKNNKVGLDFYRPVFMSKSVKATIREINQIIQETGTYSVRIKVNYSTSIIVAKILVSFFGLALVAYAQKFPPTTQQLWGNIEVNASFSQLIGSIFALIPWVVEPIINKLTNKTAGKK